MQTLNDRPDAAFSTSAAVMRPEGPDPITLFRSTYALTKQIANKIQKRKTQPLTLEPISLRTV